MPQNETAVASASPTRWWRSRRERLRQRRRRRHADRTAASTGRAPGSCPSSAEPGTSATAATRGRLQPRDRAFYMSQLCFFRALPLLRGAGLQVRRQRADLDAGPAGRACRVQLRLRHGHGRRLGLQRQGVLIAVDNTPTSPHYGRIYVTYTKFHLQPTGSATTVRSSSLHRHDPDREPVLSTWSHTAIQPDNPGGNGTGASANQFS